MTILTRVTGKVFGSQAPLDEIGVFGSAKAGSGINSDDVATIQGNVAYLQGWGSGIVSAQNFPPMEEVTGVLKTISYQACYALQSGVPIYDANTEYGKGDIVKLSNGVQLEFYIATRDATTDDHTPNINKWGNSSFWQKALIIGEREVGVPQITLNPTSLPTNCVWLEGQEFPIGDFPNLHNIYTDTYNDGTESAGNFRLPDFREKYICGVSRGSETTVGYVSAGLPKITCGGIGDHTHGVGTYHVFGRVNTIGRTSTSSGTYRDGLFTEDHYVGSSGFYPNTNSYGTDIILDAYDGTGFSGKSAPSGAHSHTISSPLINNSLNTVKVDGIKVRVYTRYQ